MSEHTDRRRRTARVAMTSLLVASGIGIVGVAPAMAANNSPAPAAFHSDHDKDRGWGKHNRLFRDRGDFRYVWFRVCDGTATGTATTTTTTPDPAVGTTTETVAPDALAAAVEGAAVETATSTDAVPPVDTLTTDTLTTNTLTPDTLTTGTTTTAPTTVAADDPAAKAYPIFVVVPIPKDETKAIYELDKRPCYDLTTGEPRLTDTATTTTTTTDAAPVVTAPSTGTTTTTTTVETPVGTVTG